MNTYKQIFILLFAISLFGSCKNTPESEETVPENTAESNQLVFSKTILESAKMSLEPITIHDFFDIVQATGSIQVPVDSKAEISPMVAGFVSSIPFIVGDNVRKGDLLFQLQNHEFIAMQQRFLEVKEELKFLQSEFERQKLLAEENINSQKNFQKASSDYKFKLAQYNGLRETLKLLNVDMAQLEDGVFTSKIRIYSPIDGFISDINTAIGSYVAPGDVLSSLINTSHKHLELEVFEKDVFKLANGQDIRFRVPDVGNAYFAGTVFQVNKSIDMERRTLLVHGHLADKQANFLQGMYIEAEILTDKLSGLAVPTKALLEEEGNFYVLLFQSENDKEMVFEKTPVNVGRITDQFTQILGSSLKAGDMIMDEGVFSLMGN